MPEPYADKWVSECGTVTLLNGDCLDLMPAIGPGSVDAIIADLPYGTTACKWDSVIPFAPMWECFKRVTKPKAAIVLTATQPFASALVTSNPGSFRCDWIWEKQKGANFPQAKRRPLRVHESVLVFSDGPTTYNPQMVDLDRVEYRAPSDRKVSRGFSAVQRPGSPVANTLRGGTYMGRFPRSIQKFSNEGMNRGSFHPTQKPVALMEYLIRTYTNEGETVLDCTFGSGTTAVACVNTGRNFIGIERDEGYFNIAVDRISAALADRDSQLVPA